MTTGNGSSGSGNSGNGAAWESALGAKGLTEEFGELSHSTEDEGIARAEESTVDGDNLLGEGGDTLQDSTETGIDTKASTKPEATQKTSGEKEVITVTDETGRKRKVEIDFSNKEQIKKVFAQAAGMRKFQAERDREIQAKRTIETRLQEREKDWGILEEAFSKGHANLIDVLSGKQGAFQELVDKEIQKREFLRNARPEEIEALEARERGDLQAKELEKIRKENEKFRSEMTKEREEAETRAMESKVHPVFDKYRFAGKLGSAQDEHMFDDMLWRSSMNRLVEAEEQGVTVTPELIEREFRNISATLRKRIGVQAEKQVSKVVDQKKREATENVQARLKAGYSTEGEDAKLKKALQSGDTGSIFKNWSSFKKTLSNR